MQGENKESLEEFSWRLNRAQESAGMSQAEIATLLKVTPQRVGNWFQGRNLPRHNVVVQLAKLLGVSVEFLLHGTKDESSSPVAHAVGEDEQAPYGTGADIERDVRRQFDALIAAAAGDPERLHWIAVQLREHLTAPKSWKRRPVDLGVDVDLPSQNQPRSLGPIPSRLARPA